MSVNHIALDLPVLASFIASGDYDHGTIPDSIWFTAMTQQHCFRIATFLDEDGPNTTSESFQIVVLPANVTVVVTIHEVCAEGTVKLVNGRNGSEGTVMVCHGGRYGSICSSVWTREDAVVVCNQLGFSNPGSHTNPGSNAQHFPTGIHKY